MRRTLAGLAIALTVGSLVACGGSPGRSTSSSTAVSTRPSTSRPVSTSTTIPVTTTHPATTTLPVTTTAPAPAPPPNTTAPGPAPPSGVPAGLAGVEWNTIPTSSREVALTFDAGANADGVASILRTLGDAHVRATFFLTGEFVAAFPASARAIAAAGMRIGDHSVSHPRFTELTDAEIRSQVLAARAEIRSVTASDPSPWFRFPYFDRDARTIAAVNSAGFVPIGWTVDTLGWEGSSAGITVDSIVRRVLGYLRPGAVIVMHCGSNPDDHSTLDAAALPSVISALRARGYSFVTVDALLR